MFRKMGSALWIAFTALCVALVSALSLTGCSNANVPAAVAGFSLVPADSSVVVAVGSTASSAIAVTGQTTGVALSATNLPTGVTGTFSPLDASGTSSLTLAAGDNAAEGQYDVTVVGNTASTSARTHISVSVTKFTLSASPANLTLGPNSSVSSTISVAGAISNVQLAASGLPAGVSASFNPISTTKTSTVTFTSTSSVTPGSYVVRVTGTSGYVSASTNLSITVTGATQVPLASFSLVPSTSALAFTSGSSVSNTITVADQNGFSGTVSLTASGLPAGVTAVFGSVSTSTSSTVTFAASSSVAPGSYTATINGTSGSLSAQTSINLTISAGPSFRLSSSTGTLSVAEGSSAPVTITVQGANSFKGTVNMAVAGLPPGLTASFSPASTSTSSTLTFAASSSVAPGSYTATINGTSGSLSASAKVSVTVPTPSFSLSSSPGTISFAQGSTGTTTVTIAGKNGFSSMVNLLASGLPAGVTASFSTPSTSTSSLVTFSAAGSAVPGSYPVAIKGTANGSSVTAPLNLTISAAPSFTLASAASTVSLFQGNSVPTSIQVVAANSFNGTVTLSIAGLPTGVTAGFSPQSTTASSTLNLTASNVAAPGTYSATVTGTSGSLTATTPITITIPTPSFSLSSSPGTLSFAQGTSAPTTVSVNGANGFGGNVSLSVSGLPSGLTASFNPATTTSNSTLTFTSTGSVAAGPYTATVTGTSSGSGSTTASTAVAITITQPPAGPGNTWYVRTDGGSRYSSNIPTGQCDGRADAPYPGSGVNQHCAFNDFRYLYDDGSYGNFAWVISGGDTVVIEGCAAASDQQNPDAPHCRIGWDTATGSGSLGWCAGSQANFGCYNPNIPSGTASQHTRILGACALNGTCNSGNVTNRANLTQLFGGFGSFAVFNLSSAQYVDVVGIEFTTHNGKCVHYGAPAYPKTCSNSSPADDYADQGIVTNASTGDILLQDVYIDGMAASGLAGPIGGAITMKRVNVSFNGFAGWNFDNGSDTPDAPGSSIDASYVTMIGNGCNQEYPIVHTAFPAFACYDSTTGGFGDSWSGQDTELDSFTCDHCVNNYNTKDAFIGPHTQIKNLSITNSESIGNMGQSWKWGTYPGGSLTFENNLTVGNCFRMSQALPGAAQNFNQSTGLPGAHLANFCRAAGMVFGVIAASNSTWTVNGNTIVTYQPTIFDLNCQTSGACGTTTLNFTNNIILGYTAATNYYPGASGSAPGMYYFEDSSVPHPVTTYTVEYGTRNNDCGSGSAHIICSDPLLVNEPSQGSIPPETMLDGFNFHPNSYSPAVGAGLPSGLSLDFYGVTRPSAPTLGAVEP